VKRQVNWLPSFLGQSEEEQHPTLATKKEMSTVEKILLASVIISAVSLGVNLWKMGKSDLDLVENPRKMSVADRAALRLVADYVDRYALNRGLKAEFPRLVVGMMKELDGWPVRNADGGSNIAYFSTYEAADSSLSKVRRAFRDEQLKERA